MILCVLRNSAIFGVMGFLFMVASMRGQRANTEYKEKLPVRTLPISYLSLRFQVIEPSGQDLYQTIARDSFRHHGRFPLQLRNFFIQVPEAPTKMLVLLDVHRQRDQLLIYSDRK